MENLKRVVSRDFDKNTEDGSSMIENPDENGLEIYLLECLLPETIPTNPTNFFFHHIESVV